MTIPTAVLRPEYAMINPPKLLGFGIFVDGKLMAVLPVDEVAAAQKYLTASHQELNQKPTNDDG